MDTVLPGVAITPTRLLPRNEMKTKHKEDIILARGEGVSVVAAHDWSVAIAVGDGASAEARGWYSVAIAIGPRARVRGQEGAFIACGTSRVPGFVMASLMLGHVHGGGQVGAEGIEPGVWYTEDDAGNLVEWKGEQND